MTSFFTISHVERTGSTNADLAQRARANAPEGMALVAEHQDAGRGRLGRDWHTPAGLAMTVSFLLRPSDVQANLWSWIPLLTGVAVVDAIAEVSGVEPTLKWPNDVLIADRKLAGILVERVDTPSGAAAIVGVGLNVLQGSDDLPPTATSLRLAGSDVSRDDVLAAVAQHLAESYLAWRAAHGDPRTGTAAAYLKRCSTVGRSVTAALPGGDVLSGRAVDVDEFGRLVVEVADGSRTAVGAGEIVHLRPR